MAKHRGRGRFTQNEAERWGRAAKEVGAEVEFNPATGVYRMIFPPESNKTARQERRPDRPEDILEQLK
jgi:hypothetical protein